MATKFEEWCRVNGYDPESFDFRQVLPKCWVRDGKDYTWISASYLRSLGSTHTYSYLVITENGAYSQYRYCTFEDPNTSRKAELKARADELRAELAKIEAELGE
jgi:hypothetical protein